MVDALSQLYRASENAAAGAIGDEVALLDFATDVYYTMNGSGALIWRLLQTPCSLEQLALALAAEYDVPAAVAQADVSELVSELVRTGLAEAVAP